MEKSTQRALILTQSDFGEADRRISLLTDKGELIIARAKSIRTQSSKLKSLISPFREVKIQLIASRSQPIIAETEMIEIFALDQAPIATLSAGLLINEIASTLLSRAPSEPRNYQLIKEVWQCLLFVSSRRILGYYIFNLMELLDYGVQTRACPVCQKTLAGSGLYLSPSDGGVVDSRHRFNPNSMAIRPDQIKLIRLTKLPLSEFCTIRVTARQEKQFADLSLFWLDHHLTRPLKSREFWEGQLP